MRSQFEASLLVNANNDEQRKTLYNYLSQISNNILICGPSYTGKSYFLDRFNTPNRNVIKWDRERLLSALTGNRDIKGNIFSIMEDFENKMIYEIREKFPYDLLVKTTTGNSFSSRSRAMKPEGSTLLVFTGPEDLIVQRKLNDKQYMLNKTEAEIVTNTQLSLLTFSPPRFGEGWRKIIYVNTFGDRGEEYLIDTVYTVGEQHE